MHESSHRNRHSNRLAQETSPYLLQHAGNPVDWHPWGECALELARREDKPILLSIGYSACHWCHVMAHESFEDPASAAVMNELFVNIKVDREERPDLDRIYQIAQQMLTQRGGGWPLTMFFSPRDQRPFFGGTYFPKQAGHGLPAFTDLLRRVAEFYRTRSEDIAQQSAALQQAFDQLHGEPAAADTALTLAPLSAAREQLAAQFDARIRRLRHGSEISASHQHRLSACANGAARRAATARPALAVHGDADAQAHGRRRHLRSTRWRLRALQRRSILDDPALRKDAVRQRPAAA